MSKKLNDISRIKSNATVHVLMLRTNNQSDFLQKEQFLKKTILMCVYLDFSFILIFCPERQATTKHPLSLFSSRTNGTGSVLYSRISLPMVTGAKLSFYTGMPLTIQALAHETKVLCLLL